MKSASLRDVIHFALIQDGLSQKILYIIKGLLFLMFFLKNPKKMNGKEQSVPAASQAGDDIYPLF
jgi:hypothetical protein